MPTIFTTHGVVRYSEEQDPHTIRQAAEPHSHSSVTYKQYRLEASFWIHGALRIRVRTPRRTPLRIGGEHYEVGQSYMVDRSGKLVEQGSITYSSNKHQQYTPGAPDLASVAGEVASPQVQKTVAAILHGAAAVYLQSINETKEKRHRELDREEAQLIHDKHALTGQLRAVEDKLRQIAEERAALG